MIHCNILFIIFDLNCVKLYKYNFYIYIMSISNFLHNDNVKILWDVIFDEDIIKNHSREFQESIFHLFINNIKGFYEAESKKLTSLVDMNKKYILLILNHANKSIQKLGIPEYKKIKILDEFPRNGTDLITYEEIQNDKRSQFDKDLNKRQEEFTNAMSLPVPPVPKFSDKLDDGPINEMEKAIQEITAQRNYDVEQINRNNNNSITTSNADNWLKPQETSLKSDKMIQQPQINNSNNSNNSNRIKYIKIENTDIENNYETQNLIINLDKREQDSPKKNVTWGKNEVYSKNESNEIKLTIEEKEEDNSDNIFKLFKRVPVSIPLVEQKTNEDKISILQQDVKNLNNKLDTILELLKNNK